MTSADPQVHLWRPSEEQLERSDMARFMRWAGELRGRPFADYDELWRWSVGDIDGFWAAMWEFSAVRASHAYACVLDSHHMPGTRWRKPDATE